MATQPHLLVDEGDLNDIALIPGDPGRVDRIAAQCDSSEVVSENREYKVVNAEYEGVPLTICSTGIGCPSATIAIEEMHAVGVETVIRVGTTGALQEDIEIGDMVVATGAAKDEGTTRRYEKDTYPAVPDYHVLSALVDSAETHAGQWAADGASGEIAEQRSAVSQTPSGETASNDEDVHVGPIASDDAFYAETDEYVESWEEANILAVEMEAAAVFSIARRKGMRSGAICTVDGNLVKGTQKGTDTEDDELPEKAKNNVERAIRITLDAVVSLS